MASPTPLNQSQYLGQNVKNEMIPKEGPQAVPLSIPFDTGSSFAIDLTLQQIRKYVSIIQCLFIDNSANASPLSVFVSVVNQNMICPPNSQMYVPILVPQNAILTATCVGGQPATIDLINVPLPFGIWPADTYIPTFGAGGAMMVIDALAETYLAQIVTNTASAGGSATVQGLSYRPADKIDEIVPLFLGGVAYTQNITASGSTNLISASAGNGDTGRSIFVTSLYANVSADAALAAAATLSVSVICNTPSGANTLAKINLPLPAVAAIGGNFSQQIIARPDFNYLSQHAYNGINATNIAVTLSAALVSGSIDVTVVGGMTNKGF